MNEKCWCTAIVLLHQASADLERHLMAQAIPAPERIIISTLGSFLLSFGALLFTYKLIT